MQNWLFARDKVPKKLLDAEMLKSYCRKVIDDSLSIPYNNFYEDNMAFSDEIAQELSRVISLKNELEQDIYIKEFESLFAAYCGIPYAVGVASGTAALSFSLMALNIGPGDEVITTPHTYIATALAIADVGARPVFVDIGNDFNINSREIEGKITTRTKAIIPVHLYGNPCAIEEILKIAAKHNLSVIEDVCQAHGASINERKVGTFGHAGCFSFHPSKTIAGLGDGGIVITSDRNLSKKIRRLREPIYNDRDILKSHRTPACLNVINIPFLLVKLKHIDKIVEKRKAIAAIYNRNFANISELILPGSQKNGGSSYRNYTLRAKNRNGLFKYLFSHGIQAKIFYDTPLYLRNEFKHLGYAKKDFPVCEEFYQQIISLPISYSLKPEQVELISQKVGTYYA